MDSAQLLSVVLKCPAKADAGSWSRCRPDVFSEGEPWPPLEVSVGGGAGGSLLDTVQCYSSVTAITVLSVSLSAAQEPFALQLGSGDELRRDGQKSFVPSPEKSSHCVASSPVQTLTVISDVNCATCLTAFALIMTASIKLKSMLISRFRNALICE